MAYGRGGGEGGGGGGGGIGNGLSSLALQRSEPDPETGRIKARGWRELPRASQLNDLRYNSEQLALGDIIMYSSKSTTSIKYEERDMDEVLARSGVHANAAECQVAIPSAYAIACFAPLGRYYLSPLNTFLMDLRTSWPRLFLEERRS